MPDVIVVGGGGGGPVVAKELAARGLDVLVLEAGPWHRKPEDVWTDQELDAAHPVRGYFRVGPGDRSKPPWVRELVQNSYLTQTSGVGGTTLHYYANSPRAMPGAFAGYTGADAAGYDRAFEFPFSYDELVPYYEWVEATLPVQTAPVTPREAAFFKGCERMGLPLQRNKNISRDSFRPQENAILQPGGTAGTTRDSNLLTFPQATGCTLCGHCFQGCVQPRESPINLRAKRATNVSYVPMALTADAWQDGGKAATLIADAYVTKVITESVGGRTRVKAVRWRDTNTGAVNEVTATVVVLAGGAIESPRLWLNSGLPNPNKWVGHGFDDRHFDIITGVMPDDIKQSQGQTSGARADFPTLGSMQTVGFGPALQAFAMNLSDSGINGLYRRGTVDAAGADGLGRVTGAELRALMSGGVDRLLNIAVITDHDVDYRNHVGLSTILPPDENGPIPRVEFQHFSQRSLQNREELAKKAVQILRAAGATKVFRINFAALLLHVQGTMRMGSDPATSVVGPTGEARHVDGVFIADNSALSNGLGGPNPTLTMQAVATRTAESIFTAYFAGDPWVSVESPTSSIDDRVTAAVVARDI